MTANLLVVILLAQVPALDARNKTTMEEFARVRRETTTQPVVIKEGLRAFYQPGSQKSYVLVKGIDPKTGKVGDKRVVFINRRQAVEWAAKNGERLIFTPLGVPSYLLPHRVGKYSK